MNNQYIRHTKYQQAPRSTHSLIQKNMSESKQTIVSSMGRCGLNSNFLIARREQFLNSGYYVRKKKLEDITEENKKIYLKINSQKSAYSRDQMRKSYQSNASLSRRLSQSKISKRSISQASMRSSKITVDKNKIKKKKQYRLQTKSIASIGKQQISKYKTIFKTEQQNLKPQIPSQHLSQKKTKQAGNTTKINLPPLKTISNMKPRAKSHTMKIPLTKYSQGAFLHIIAQQMFGKQKKLN